MALADNPPYVFRDTPQHLIEEYYHRLTNFVGYAEPEVMAAEARLRVKFPAVFRQYLREMAKSPGDLFRGSDLSGIADFERFRADALALMAETDPALSLPPEVVVFLMHQGYTFTYLVAMGGFDGPPMQYVEGARESQQVAPTFASMVDAQLRLMEQNNDGFRENGGYYLTLYPDGGASREFPALASGERPLDQARSRKR
jgi:hypothetical protein